MGRPKIPEPNTYHSVQLKIHNSDKKIDLKFGPLSTKGQKLRIGILYFLQTNIVCEI